MKNIIISVLRRGHHAHLVIVTVWSHEGLLGEFFLLKWRPGANVVLVFSYVSTAFVILCGQLL